MRIVWICSEAVPFAKSGGLADVSNSLPKAFSERGHKVSVIMPFYPQIMESLKLKFSVKIDSFGVPFGKKNTEWAQILEHEVNPNLSFFFIVFNRFFDRPGLYDWKGEAYFDNGARFIFFARAAMEAMLAMNIEPDIVHCNDWHSSLCNVYLRSPLYKETANFAKTHSVLTIHNIGYQGVFDKACMNFTGLGWEYFNYLCLEFFDQINLLKGGIMSADIVNTVSPTHASEILAPEHGFELDGPLRHRAAFGRFCGILNGIDVDEWNPETDQHLPMNYSIDDMLGKAVCKKALQKEFGLPQRKNIPLFGLLSRLAHQKGIDVFAESIEPILLNDDAQFVIIGSGEPDLQEGLNALQARFPKKLAVYIGYAPDRLAHLLEAGVDMFIMPSRYEPCGLNQMYSMRYGTLPVVRATGGLEDSVDNYDTAKLSNSTGFKFWDLTPLAMTNTLRWAAKTYRTLPKHFETMRRNAMERDFSWNHTAAIYEQLYNDTGRRF